MPQTETAMAPVLPPGQFFPKENPGEHHGKQAVAGDQWSCHDGVFRDGVDIEKLAGSLARGAQALFPFVPQAELLLLTTTKKQNAATAQSRNVYS